MRGNFRLYLLLLLSIAFARTTVADTDPSLSQVYEAVQAGHLAQPGISFRDVRNCALLRYSRPVFRLPRPSRCENSRTSFPEHH
jgi:phage head maturation protease